MKLTFLFISVLLTLQSVAQEQEALKPVNLTRLGEVLPPSPNAASLGRFGGIPVNMSSGKPNVNIPLYEIKTPNLSVPISVSYSTSGFNVDEIASWVGLSWSLNIGGVITRTVFDGADEYSDHPTIPAGFNSGTENQTIYDFLNLVQQGDYDYVDMQPDIFSYNFGRYQGKFIINGGSIVTLPHSNLNIRTSLIETAFIDGCHFKVTTPEGVAYYFGGVGAYETSASESFGFNCGANKDFNTNETAWYLKKIVHPNGDLIEFFYSPVNLNYKASIREAQTRKTAENLCYPTSAFFYVYENSTCITKILNYGVRLDQIMTSSGQKIIVNYKTRTDLIGDFLVQDISLYKFDTTIRWKYFYFDYDEVTASSFMNSWNQNDADLKQRVFLKSITEKNDAGTVTGQDFKFSYTTYSGLPARLSFARDYWGFFNGKTNSTLLYLTDPNINNLSDINPLFSANANRTPDAVYSQKGLLSKITYPTGGWDDIVYEGHTYKVTEQQKTNVQNITVATNGASYDESGVPTIKESTPFTPSQNQSVNFRITCAYFGESGFEPALDKARYSIFNITNNQYALSEATLNAGDGVVNEVNKTVNLIAGKSYKIIIKIYGIEVSGSATLIYQNYTWAAVTVNKPVGGVRVSKITSTDPVANNVSVKKYLYSFLNDLNYSSCDNVNYFFENLTASKMVEACGFSCEGNTANYYTINSGTYYNIAPFSGSNISYKSVIESHGENFENGGIEYLFTSEPDEPPIRKYGAMPMSSPFSNLDWAHGLTTYQREFSFIGGSYVTKNEEITTYKVDSRITNNYPGYVIRKNHFKPCYLLGDINTEDFYGVTPFDVYEFQVQKRWMYLETVTTKIYPSSGGSGIVSQTLTYEHLNTSNLQPTKVSTTNSKNEPVALKTRYAGDLFTANQPVWLANLQFKGFTEAPIEQLTTKTIGGIEYVVAGQLIIYHNTWLKPSVIYKLGLSSPVAIAQFTVCAVSSGVFTYDSRYKFITQYTYAPIFGNLIQKIDLETTQMQSYIWDYKNTYPIAQVSNAGEAHIAYTSFEADGKGNWTFTGALLTEPTAPGGNKAYSLNNGTISRSGLNTTTTYKISYWKKDGVGTVTVGAFAGTPLLSKNGWTCYEHTITGVTQITISGSATVDELRVYPVGSLMTSYTYEPLIGITTQSDPNNRISYYEYDAFGRLILVRDQDKNIIKKICYNYAGQPEENCTAVTYSNVARSGVFIRNNCAAGSTGSSVTYTVAAGTYTSTTGQVDADQQAQNDVNANGQAYANANGTCIYSNMAKSGTFTRNNCAAGGTPSTVTYTVAAGAYTSTIGQADADAKAQNDVNANGQTYANTNGTCTYRSVAKSGVFTRKNCGSGTGSSVTYTVVAGAYTSTISQADADAKAQNEINANGQAYANANGTCTYRSVAKSGVFTRNNCPAGSTPSSITYTVAAGAYTSTIGQVDADAKAQNDVNANGQAYANANGTCMYSSVAMSGSFCRNDCPAGTSGACVTSTVAAGAYTSTISQANADQKAVNELNSAGQAYANAIGFCSCGTDFCAFSNTQQNQTFVCNNCPDGNRSTVTYTVAAGTYSSNVSQAAADEMAINEIKAKGQTHANAKGTGCSSSNCSGLRYKCIKGNCEEGKKINTSSVWDNSLRQYRCLYHYKWSDGSRSKTYTEYLKNPCAVMK